MNEVTLTGQLICKTEAEANRVKAALQAHIDATRAEAGCLSFNVDATDEPLVWQVDERFNSPEAFEAHQTRAAGSPWAVETAGIERAYTITGMPK